MAFITFFIRRHWKRCISLTMQMQSVQTSSISWDQEFGPYPGSTESGSVLLVRFFRWFAHMLRVWEAEVESGSAMELVSGVRSLRGHGSPPVGTPGQLFLGIIHAFIPRVCRLNQWSVLVKLLRWHLRWLWVTSESLPLAVYSHVVVYMFSPSPPVHPFFFFPAPLCLHVRSLHPHLFLPLQAGSSVPFF